MYCPQHSISFNKFVLSVQTRFMVNPNHLTDRRFIRQNFLFIKLAALLSIVLLVSCSRNKQIADQPQQLKIIPISAQWQNPQRFEKPVIVPAGEPEEAPASNPIAHAEQGGQVIPAHPTRVAAGEPEVHTPGKDGLLLPKTFPAVGKVIHVGLPEIVVVKEMGHKEHNPANFSFYRVLQGLTHNTVRCVLQDRSGNLWIATNGGGLTRFDGKNFAHFTVKQGLLDNMVTCMLLDKKGNLWLGTPNGVACYDGKTFTNYSDKNIFSRPVGCVVQDHRGRIWLGTEGGGVVLYDGRTFTKFTDKQGLGNNDVNGLVEDKSGNLWFCTNGNGLARYDGKSFSNFTETQGLVNNETISILKDKNEQLWIGTTSGVSCYDGHKFTNFSDKQVFADYQVLDILQDKQGYLWFAVFGGGLVRFDGSNFTRFTDRQGLYTNLVISQFEDRSGNLWVGTQGGGLSRYDGRRFNSFGENEGLYGTEVVSILQDRSKTLWFGKTWGGALSYNGKAFSGFSYEQGLDGEQILCLLQDRSGNIWFGTDRCISRYNGKRFSNFYGNEDLVTRGVTYMLQDKSGNIWFASTTGGLYRYDGKNFSLFTTKQGLASNSVICLLEDRSGNLWVGTDRGLQRYDGRSFTNFKKEGAEGRDFIFCLLQDKNGILWIGTENGILRYDGTRFINLNNKDGLTNNNVLAMLQDKEDNLWFGTRNGLSKMTPVRQAQLSAYLARWSRENQVMETDTDKFDPMEQALFYNYDHSDGFSGVGGRRNAVLQDSAGDIWWGADVLTCYNPKGDRADTAAPVVQLNSVKLFGEDIPWASVGAINIDSSGREFIKGTIRDTMLRNGVLLHDIHFDGIDSWHSLPQHLSLPYDNNNIKFSFIGVHMRSRNHVKYKYQMQGLEDHWTVISERNEAHYGDLPAGKYTFKVKAMNQSGVWSKPVTFDFEVRSPWWKTWWFKAAVLLVIATLFWGYIRSLEVKIAEATLEINERHKEIMDSISYAERIQRSFLATQQHLDSNLEEYFILFKPKDVVSGDFYWSATLNNGNFAIVCADSTGHGVPGAIMSLLNVTSLERAVEIETEPHKILDATRKIIIDRLNRDGDAEGGRDGMDGSLLSFDFTNNLLYCAASNNPVCIVRNGELIEIKPDHMPIGKYERDNEPFTLRTVQLQKGDALYMLTDGFADQFGGPEGKKFKYKKLTSLLLSLASEPMEVQKHQLNRVFEDWKGNLEQVDDVTVIGVRI